MSPNVPERHYTVGSFNRTSSAYLYRYDPYTGKTWYVQVNATNSPWKEIPDPN